MLKFIALATITLLGATMQHPPLEEKQLTFNPAGHDLDNGDNFTPDGRFLVYDTRETLGTGIENCNRIEKINLDTGEVTLLYQPEASVTGERPAPGVGAASVSPDGTHIIFIHGPHLSELGERGPYGKPNRNGASVPTDGSGKLTLLDKRDIATDRDTLPGAHRGGTHRHEYARNGKRIGFTYDDFLLPQYDRSVGWLEPHPNAPKGATHYFALMVPVVPKGTSKPGELEKAWGDSWVNEAGTQRAFIGLTRNADAETYEQSLYRADIPETVDITTADAGSPTRFPSLPKGITLHRLTHTWAEGIVRASYDGTRIAYYAKDNKGITQVFLIAADGSDKSDDPDKQPKQVTRLKQDVTGGLRWHPSNNSILCISDNAILTACVQQGDQFGETRFLTKHGGKEERSRTVISPDGKTIAYNKITPTFDAQGKPAKNYAGQDFMQIFLLDFPDTNGDGIAD